MQSNVAERYYGIDIIKFLCSFLVIMIHVAPFSTEILPNADSMNFYLRNCICRIAVPFYFTASGFLLFRNVDMECLDFERIKSYCFKLLRILGMWTFLLTVGGAGHLWYLGATTIAVICLSLCIYWHMKFSVLALIALILYVIGLLGDSYYGFGEYIRTFAPVGYAAKGYELFFITTRNGLFMGFPFVLIGAIFAQKKIRLKPFHAAIGFAGSMALLIVEATFLERHEVCRDYNMFISLLPAAFFLFAFAISFKLRRNTRYEKLQVIGVLIYYMHMAVSFCIDIVFGLIVKFTGFSLYPFLFPATAAATLLAAILIQNLSQRKSFSWLQYLYR